MLKHFVTALTGRQYIAKATLEIHFQRPDDFTYLAGQHVNCKLSALLFEDKKGARRTFSITSAPHEEQIIITTRDTGSGFKRTLREGPLQTVELIGPLGKMARDESRPAVFIAGGIGITPFRSMILDARFRQVQSPVTLLYSNHNLENAAYHDLFVELSQMNSGWFTYAPTLTRQTPGNFGWHGERRRIDAAFLKDYVPDFSAATFYTCGPPAFASAITDILAREGVRQEHILSESFWGY